MPSSRDRKYWLALSKTPELGPARLKILYEHFKSAQNIREASKQQFMEVEGIGSLTADKIFNAINQIDINEKMDIDPDIQFLTLSDPDYPINLYNIYDPPPIIYFKGSIIPKDSNSIGIVGTRKSTYYGEETTRKLVKDLAQANVTIISGLACGIDSIAHLAALDYGVRTIAVFGCGLNTVYPSTNKQLSKDIAKNGALVSEFESNAPIEKWNFVRRNRIISGLSLGVVVIEGDSKSGTLITAKYALEQNREVFAVPGCINNVLSQGPNSLIKQGAKLVESAKDILDELHISYENKSEDKNIYFNSSVNPDERLILEALQNEPKYIDRIATDTKFPIEKTSILISSLILSQAVKELPGKYFVVNK